MFRQIHLPIHPCIYQVQRSHGSRMSAGLMAGILFDNSASHTREERVVPAPATVLREWRHMFWMLQAFHRRNMSYKIL